MQPLEGFLPSGGSGAAACSLGSRGRHHCCRRLPSHRHRLCVCLDGCPAPLPRVGEAVATVPPANSATVPANTAATTAAAATEANAKPNGRGCRLRAGTDVHHSRRHAGGSCDGVTDCRCWPELIGPPTVACDAASIPGGQSR